MHVLHEQLRAAAEQVREGHAALRRIELVVLVDLTQGRARRFSASASRRRVNSFSSAMRLLAFGDPLFTADDRDA